MRSKTTRGFSLIEIATALFILVAITAILVPLSVSLMDANRAGQAFDEMSRMYTAVVGDPAQGTYGYIGDTGKFPSNLMDLVRQPASTPGWNGPYLADARVDSGVLYDPYGASYECYYRADNTGAVTDQFVIMSAGPDRGSTNIAAANACTNYNGGAIPGGYGTVAADTDNIVYPRFTDNASLLKYQHLGTLAINIMNFDQNALVNALVPGCPHLYTITVTSVSRGTNDQFTMPFNPGANSVDLPEGLYKVAVTSQTSLGSLWQEQVAIAAGATISRNINIYTGLNSSQTPNETFTPVNNMGFTIRVNEFAALIGTVANLMSGPGSGNWQTLQPCTQVFIRNDSTSVVVDAFTYPYLLPATVATIYTKRINTNALCTLTVLNRNTGNNPARNQVLVYEQGVFIGIVGSRGRLKSKEILKVKQGDNIRVYDINANLLNTPAGTTMGCPTTITIT